MPRKQLPTVGIILLIACTLLFANNSYAQGRPYPSSTVVWSSDGQKIAVSTWNGIILYTSSLQKIRQFGGPHTDIFSLSWHPDNQTLAAANADYSISIWDTTTGDRIAKLEGHNRQVLKVAWSPDGTMLASSSNDRTIRIWKNSTLLTTIEYATSGYDLEHLNAVGALAWNSDGTLLAGGDRSHIYVWKAANQFDLVTKFEHHAIGGGLGNSLYWMLNGQDLIAVGTEVWNIATGNKQILALGCSTGSDTVLALSPDGYKVASAGFDAAVGTMGCIITLDNRSSQYSEIGRQNIQFMPNPALPSSIAWSPDSRQIATSIRNGTTSLWDATSGNLIAYAPRPDATTSTLLSSLDVCASPELGATLTSNVENNQLNDFVSNIQSQSGEILPNCRQDLILAAQFFIKYPTPTPQPSGSAQAVSLMSLCSPFPDDYRVWLIQNPNPYAIDFSWTWTDKQPSSIDAAYGVVPGAQGGVSGKREFTTPTQTGTNSIIVKYGYEDGMEVKASSNDTQCINSN